MPFDVQNNIKDDTMTKCDMCCTDVSDEKIEHITVKGKVKTICNSCIAAIKGFV